MLRKKNPDKPFGSWKVKILGPRTKGTERTGIEGREGHGRSRRKRQSESHGWSCGERGQGGNLRKVVT